MAEESPADLWHSFVRAWDYYWSHWGNPALTLVLLGVIVATLTFYYYWSGWYVSKKRSQTVRVLYRRFLETPKALKDKELEFLIVNWWLINMDRWGFVSTSHIRKVPWEDRQVLWSESIRRLRAGSIALYETLYRLRSELSPEDRSFLASKRTAWHRYKYGMSEAESRAVLAKLEAERRKEEAWKKRIEAEHWERMQNRGR